MNTESALPPRENGSTLPRMIGAVIYVRVSDPRQAENLSLSTQLKACEEYCQRNGLEVVARFKEEGESAKTADRTELQNLLTYCRKNKGKVQFVIVYNLTRFAREKYDHFALRTLLKTLGISLRSATEPIDDTATGKLLEGVLAAVAQFDNDVRAERTRTGMQAAMALGRWVFAPPLGYLPGERRGKSLKRDPGRAPLVRRAFEEMATGEYTKTEVLARVTRLGLRTRNGLTLTGQTLGQMLRNRVYAGFIESPDLGVSRQGDFDPIVSEALFYKVQAVTTGVKPAFAMRLRSRPDFPLRNFVRCATCQRPLTGSWSTGHAGGRYAYYHCQKECRAANIAKAKLEGLFVDELRRLEPTTAYMEFVREHVLALWKQRQERARKDVEWAEARAETIRQKLDRVESAYFYENKLDEESYERHRDKLQQELTLAKIQCHSTELEELDVEGILAFACRLLPSAANSWTQAALDQRQRLQALFFPKGIEFDGANFNRTSLTGSAFSYLDESEGGKSKMVSPEGIEPSTNRLMARLSKLAEEHAEILFSSPRAKVAQAEFGRK